MSRWLGLFLLLLIERSIVAFLYINREEKEHQGTSKNLALLVFSVPSFIFWLKEGVLSMSYMLFL
jgi:hypothetical protein